MDQLKMIMRDKWRNNKNPHIWNNATFDPIEKQDSLEILNYQIRACNNCALFLTRKHALPGEGGMDAKVMFIALSPAVKEDAQNRQSTEENIFCSIK